MILGACNSNKHRCERVESNKTPGDSYPRRRS